VDCAVRELWEEIGINIKNKIDPNTFIDMERNGTKNRFYIVPGISESYNFKANNLTRFEIGEI
jgi:mRNA-decapping enzyme subunit 2